MIITKRTTPEADMGNASAPGTVSKDFIKNRVESWLGIPNKKPKTSEIRDQSLFLNKIHTKLKRNAEEKSRNIKKESFFNPNSL